MSLIIRECPFCGATDDAVILQRRVNAMNDVRYVYVECQCCGARTRTKSIFDDEEQPETGYSDSEKRVIYAWNMRV